MTSRKVVGSPVGEGKRPFPLVGDMISHPLPLELLPVREDTDALPVSEACVPAVWG